jgi:hypothetical protein
MRCKHVRQPGSSSWLAGVDSFGRRWVVGKDDHGTVDVRCVLGLDLLLMLLLELAGLLWLMCMAWSCGAHVAVSAASFGLASCGPRAAAEKLLPELIHTSRPNDSNCCCCCCCLLHFVKGKSAPLLSSYCLSYGALLNPVTHAAAAAAS